MKIKFLGAAGTVTGSSYVLTSESGQPLLIDLGMFQGTPDIEQLNYEPFEYDANRLSAMILTHAHLDHCGRLPILIPKDFKGDIWMTPATYELTELSLLDSAKINKNDSKPFLYDEMMVRQAVSQFKTVEYHKPVTIGDFTVMFVDAGHILGSASLIIEDHSPGAKVRRIVFSADLGNTPEPLQRATEYIDSADVVVMESTYGDRLHPHENPIDAIQNEINSVEQKGGTLLIPAFSLERTQEILHFIKHLKDDKKILPQTKIYLDSPMAEKATEIYIKHPELFNDHVRKELSENSPFEFPGLSIIYRASESEAVREDKQPKVIIAGSGMMTGGRIVGHAEYFLPIASTRLLIVGFQGEGTLGRALQEGAQSVIINDHHVSVQAMISVTRAMSSHADQGQLIDWLRRIKNTQKVFLTHGEDGPRQALAAKVTEELGISDVVMPQRNEEVSFSFS